jgi:hypothetical protein
MNVLLSGGDGVFNATLTPLIHLAGRPYGISLPARTTALQQTKRRRGGSWRKSFR